MGDLPFWQWYGTRIVWATMGDDYCPFCEGEMVATWLLWCHCLVGGGAFWAVYSVTGSVNVAVLSFFGFLAVGVMASNGFSTHLKSWQSDTEEMVNEAAEANDLEVQKIPSNEVPTDE